MKSMQPPSFGQSADNSSTDGGAPNQQEGVQGDAVNAGDTSSISAAEETETVAVAVRRLVSHVDDCRQLLQELPGLHLSRKQQRDEIERLKRVLKEKTYVGTESASVCLCVCVFAFVCAVYVRRERKSGKERKREKETKKEKERK